MHAVVKKTYQCNMCKRAFLIKRHINVHHMNHTGRGVNHIRALSETKIPQKYIYIKIICGHALERSHIIINTTCVA